MTGSEDRTNSLSFDEVENQGPRSPPRPAAHSRDYWITPLAAAGLKGLDWGLTNELSYMLNVSAKVTSVLWAGRVSKGGLGVGAPNESPTWPPATDTSFSHPYAWLVSLMFCHCFTVTPTVTPVTGDVFVVVTAARLHAWRGSLHRALVSLNEQCGSAEVVRLFLC